MISAMANLINSPKLGKHRELHSTGGLVNHSLCKKYKQTSWSLHKSFKSRMILFSFGFCKPPAWSPEKKISLWGAPLRVWGKRFDKATCLTWGFLSLRKGISCRYDIEKSASDLECMRSPREAGRPSEISHSRDRLAQLMLTLTSVLVLCRRTERVVLCSYGRLQ